MVLKVWEESKVLTLFPQELPNSSIDTISRQHSLKVHQHARYGKTKIDGGGFPPRVCTSESYQTLIPLREERVTALFTTRATRPAPSSLALVPCIATISSSSTKLASSFITPLAVLFHRDLSSTPSLTGCLQPKNYRPHQDRPPSSSRAYFFRAELRELRKYTATTTRSVYARTWKIDMGIEIPSFSPRLELRLREVLNWAIILSTRVFAR